MNDVARITRAVNSICSCKFCNENGWVNGGSKAAKSAEIQKQSFEKIFVSKT